MLRDYHSFIHRSSRGFFYFIGWIVNKNGMVTPNLTLPLITARIKYKAKTENNAVDTKLIPAESPNQISTASKN